MPIEIKELIIKASVQDGPTEGGKNNGNTPIADQKNGSREDQIVSRCVEQVMEILRIQNER